MRHHYVPQFLLRAWADTTPDGKVETFRLDLDEVPSTRHAPKHIGYEHDLYALSVPQMAGMDKQAIEKHFLRKVDNDAARVLQTLTSLRLNDLTASDRNDWARFLMSLRIRQPATVDKLRTLSEEHLRRSLEESPAQYQELAGQDD